MSGCRSSLSFGIRSENKKILDMKKIRFQNRRFTLFIGVAIFSLILILVSLLVFDVLNSSKAPKNSKRKKSMVENLNEPSALKQVKETKEETGGISAVDVELVPEKEDREEETRRMDPQVEKHPNHRYKRIESKDEIIKKMMKEMYDENGWSPQPFKVNHQPIKSNNKISLNNIQDIIKQFEKQSKQQFQSLSRPIPFKGVYIKPVEEEQNDQNYLQQINEMIEKEGNPGMPFKKMYGKPNHLNSVSYTQAIYHPYDKSQDSKELRKRKTEGEILKKPKKKPITVMLDIYPMSKGDEAGEDHSTSATKKPTKETIYIPIRAGEEFFEPFARPTKQLVTHLMPPRQRRKFAQNPDPNPKPAPNRMIMKLNLYPKNAEMRKKRGGIYDPRSDARIGEVFHPRDRAQRRTFGLFKKLKNKFKHKDEDTCELIGHKPHGKPITAKWKDSKGEWVHAKYVALKQWDDEDDWDRKGN